MINSLHIQNIQSHIDSKLDFSPGVNMIIGPSDKGKSAVLNALFWAYQNRPLGDPHRNWGGGIMKSKVVLDNGTVTITRDKQTEYKITQNKKTKKYKASGQNPPDEVTNLFNMDRKINFQRQLEKDAPIFMLSESPGEVAAFLNKVAGLNKIKETETKGKADLRSTYNQLQNTKDQIKDKEQEIAKFQGLDEIYAKVCLTHQIAQKCDENRRILNNISLMLCQIEKIEGTVQNLTEKLKMKVLVDKAIVIQDKIRDTLVYIEKLSDSIHEIDATERKTRTLSKKLQVRSKIQKAENYHKSIEQSKETKDSIWKKVKNIETLENLIFHLRKKEEEFDKKFHKLMPSICPLCNQEVK